VSKAADHEFLLLPQRFDTVLAERNIPAGTWPPREEDIHDLVGGCLGFIESLDAWESATHGQHVIDCQRGQISTADARRMLAREIGITPEGDIAVLLVPEAGEHSVQVELHATVEDYQGILRNPTIVVSWVQDGESQERWYPLKRKGAHWYMLSQLRDDLLEDRLVAS
jgi:hypothetical protein